LFTKKFDYLSLMPTTKPALSLSRIAYDGGYYLSYSVVFPTLFMIHIIPGGRSLISGFVDGAAAANVYLKGLRAASPRVPAVAHEPDADRPVIVPA
jgi:hypothetical protein